MTNLECARFISPLSDVVFKYLYKEGKSEYLDYIILKLLGINLKEYTLVDNEINSSNLYKSYRIDLCFKKDKNVIIIEMNDKNRDLIIKKNYQYLYRVAGNIFNKGESYSDYNVILINFNNWFSKEIKETTLAHLMMQDPSSNIVRKEIESYEIYLPRYRELCYNDDNEVFKILGMFTANNYGEMRDIAEGNERSLEFMSELEKLGIDDEFGLWYDAEIDRRKMANSLREEGKQEGIELGIKENSITTAKNLIQRDFDLDTISEITGLSMDEIKKLK